MIEPADDDTVAHHVAQRLAGALMAPAGIMLSLVKATPKAELLDVLLRAHALNRNPDSRAGEFVRAWLTYHQPGESFVASALVNRPVPRPRLDSIVDKICERSTGGDGGRARALGRFLRENSGFSLGGYHIEEVGESRGATVWTISDDAPE